MIAATHTACLDGFTALVVHVEVDLGVGLPVFSIVGLTDRAIQEARERVRSAIRNSGLSFPQHRLTVNLAPAEMRKEGSAFDLAIAVAIVRATGLELALEEAGFIGELGLDGGVRPTRGVRPMCRRLAAQGVAPIFVPAANAAEAQACGAEVVAVDTLAHLVQHLTGHGTLSVPLPPTPARPRTTGIDLADIQGQPVRKRALEIAAAGGHHLLLTGPPGAGKSMLARALVGLLPDLDVEEAMEVTAIHSIAGLLAGPGLVRRPPLRSPHHTVSIAGLLGGRHANIPGEMCLAHRGVLVMDELPEFNRTCLESLREPLEEGRVRLGRASGTRVLPASFILAATANPCPCGRTGRAGEGDCSCRPDVVTRYQKRIPGPLRDRIDLVLEVRPVTLRQLPGRQEGETSAEVAERVLRARAVQARRQTPGRLNANLSPAQLGEVCDLEPSARMLVPRLAENHGLRGEASTAFSASPAPSPTSRAGARSARRTCLRPVNAEGLEAPAGWHHCRPGSPGYPRLLQQIHVPPPLLVRGTIEPGAPMVAIVGARRSTAYGEEVAYEIGLQLAAAGVVVVSGLARGIDAAGHRGALDGGGRTVAVMGTGPDTIYPPEHRRLAERIAQSGALVSRFPVGTGPMKHNFPTRNETISGLSLGVVVVEARRRSGAMLTAGAAGNQGRAVMAVPGSVRNPASQGCRDLIRDQARLVTSARDILTEVRSEWLFRLVDTVGGPGPDGLAPDGPRFGDARDPVMDLLRTGSLTLDEVVVGVDAPGPEVVSAIARLRLDGHVRLRDGAYGVVGRRVAAPSKE